MVLNLEVMDAGCPDTFRNLRRSRQEVLEKSALLTAPDSCIENVLGRMQQNHRYWELECLVQAVAMFLVQQGSRDDGSLRTHSLEVGPDLLQVLQRQLVGVGVVTFWSRIDLAEPIEVEESVSHPALVQLFGDGLGQRGLSHSDRARECENGSFVVHRITVMALIDRRMLNS